MKIALVLSGLSRYTDETFPLLKEYLTDENTDIYVHTWNIPHNGFTPIGSWCMDQGVKSVQIERYDLFKERFPHDESVVPMYYSIWQGNNLIKEDYDIVIRCRSDIWFKEPIPKEELEKVQEDEEIIFVRYNGDIPKHEQGWPMHKGKFKLRNGYPYVADQFAFGSQKAMNIYADTFNSLETVREEVSSAGMGKKLVGELALGGHLEKHSEVYPQWSQIRFDMPTGLDNDGNLQIGNYYTNIYA